MAIPARKRTPFHRNTALWTTALVMGVVALFAAMIGTYQPAVAEAIGWFRLTLFLLMILAVGIAVHLLHVRSLERSVMYPLQRISDVTQAIVEGAVNGRITLDDQALTEVKVVAGAINRLAEKATRDIAEMKRLERVRSEFVGNVSHELRTPIFSVQGYLETLLDGALDDPQVSRQFLDKAYQNALRLNALLSDLIDISRIESGELRMSFRYFDITALLNDLVHSVEIRATQRKVQLVLDVEEQTMLQVFGDKERLSQVVTNLIDNAIKYNREGGSVTVKAERRGTVVRVSVTDTGIGIPPEAQARIFERFFRVDKDRSRAVGGTGLGLAIVKHILEAHQAPISVQSEPNVGTTISFDLKAI